MMPLPERLVAALADRYRLERELGQGGMATVYLAEDLKHHRQVAIKVLKPELAAVLGAERFVQEITTTAALQHPHILPLFDSGSADGFLFYVMPYIQGETLRDKLNRETQFGIDEAVGIATDVADALDYAHRQGVIHRDIKPENILLHDGRPMVADFGIALALSAAAGGRMTETGLSLGTPHYMSPEQATAEKEISARADVYSLGSVLYEMLTGDPPHTGASAQQIIMKIVTEDARPVTQVRKSVPPNVAAAVAMSLEKLPADRFASAAEFARALKDPGFALTMTRAQAAAARAGGLGRFPWWQVGAAAALLLAAGLLAGFLLPRTAGPGREVVRFTLPPGPGFRLYRRPFEDAPFAVSPDGKTVVFVGEDSASRKTRLYLRPVDRLDAVPIPGTEDAIAPFFSPDGRWIGFATGEDELLRKIAVTGGPPITLADDVQNSFASASWGDDGSIVYVSSGYRLSRVSGSGGPTEVLGDTAAIPGLAFWPDQLPGGRAVLFQLCTARCSTTNLAVYDIEHRETHVLVKGATQGWYLPTGHVLYATETGALFAVAFDLPKLAVTGAPVPLLDNVSTGAADGARLTVSPAGTLVYLPGGAGRLEVRLAVVDLATGRETLMGPPGEYAHPRWAPEGERVALTQYGGTQQSGEIAIYDIPSRTLSQLTFQGENVRPSWSPDGRRLAFSTDRSGVADIWWAPADGSDPGERVAEGPDVDGTAVTSWSPDGAYIVVDGIADDESDERSSEDVFAISTTAPRTMTRVVGTQAQDESGVVSPDGRWIAYNANPTGNTQVYVRPFRSPGPVGLISTGGGTEPVWLSNRELVYHDLAADSLMVATLEYGSTIRVLGRRAILDYSQYSQGGRSYQGYDVLRAARRLVLLRSAAGTNAADPVVVLHWFEELRARFAEQGVAR